MRSTRASPIMLLLLSCVACAVSPFAPQDPRQPPQLRNEPAYEGTYEPRADRWDDRYLAEVMVLPAVWLERDADQGTGPGADPDELIGVGWGLRGAFGNNDQSIGLLYQGFAVDSNRDELDVNAFYFDFDVRSPLDFGTDKDMFFVRAGAGIGTAWLDGSYAKEATLEGAAQLRFGFDCQPNRRFTLGANFGGFLFGHLGDSEAYGTFLQFEATITF